jgi:hypothetical protein
MARAKDVHNNPIVDGLSDNMKAFTRELEQKFPSIRYTSGKREAAQKVGKHHNHSHHNTGDAVDIGREHKDVYEYLYNTREGLELLTKHGLGIIDETSPEMMKKTGATGPHYHIGKDTKFAAEAKNRYTTLIKSEAPTFEKRPEFFALNLLTDQGTVPKNINIQEFEKEVAKTDVIQEKVGESETRQKIEKKKDGRVEFLKAFNTQAKDPYPVYDYSNEQPQDIAQIPISEIDVPSIQRTLPDLPELS